MAKSVHESTTEGDLRERSCWMISKARLVIPSPSAHPGAHLPRYGIMQLGGVGIMRFFKQAERPDGCPPSDGKIAAQMRSLAQVFVDSVAAQGRVLAWDTASALRLDGLCDEFVTGKPDNETFPYLTAAMGAYLGELVVRNGRGRWV